MVFTNIFVPGGPVITIQRRLSISGNIGQHVKQDWLDKSLLLHEVLELRSFIEGTDSGEESVSACSCMTKLLEINVCVLLLRILTYLCVCVCGCSFIEGTDSGEESVSACSCMTKLLVLLLRILTCVCVCVVAGQAPFKGCSIKAYDYDTLLVQYGEYNVSYVLIPHTIDSLSSLPPSIPPDWFPSPR